MARNKIFSISGTCKKFELFNIIIDAMKGVGWVDESSKAGTDFWVMTSTGEDGNRRLVVNIKDWRVSGQSTSSVITTSYNVMDVRFPIDYIPGTAGTPGTFTRSGTYWVGLAVYPYIYGGDGYGQTDMNTIIEYAISVDKDHIAFVIIPNITTGNYCVVNYIGLPDKYLLSDKNGDAMIIASSYAVGMSNTNVTIANNPTVMGAMSTNQMQRTVKCALSAFNPDADGVYSVADIFFDNSTEGKRGVVDSLVFLPNTSIFTKDTIRTDENTYKVAICQAAGSYAASSFPSIAVAYRVE